jgi:nickel transport protein
MKSGFTIQDSRYRIQKKKYRTSCILYLAAYLLSTVCCLLFVSNVDAHKVSIYAYAEGGMVYSESYFVDGTKCKNSVLEVFDEKDGTKLLEGKTDEEGKFSFKIPKVTSLKLILHASMGHQADFTLGEDEVREAMGVKQPPRSPSVKVPSKSEGSASMKIQKKETAEKSELKGISESEIEAIVERVVDRKLKPIERILVKIYESSGKPGFTEIIGGIGYIIGILGIIAYFKAKRIKKN